MEMGIARGEKGVDLDMWGSVCGYGRGLSFWRGGMGIGNNGHLEDV